MKIIKTGNLNKLKRTKRFECGHCGCIFEAELGEYHVDTQYNWDYCYCKCPICHRDAYETVLNGKEIRGNV